MKQFVYLLVVWQIAAMLLNRNIFPQPIYVLQSFAVCYTDVITHTLYSLFRIISGVFLALFVGLPFGILLGYNAKADKMFSPYVYIISPIPKIALLPIIMLFLGIGEASKIFIIFFIMLFQVVVSVRDSVKNIPPEYFVPYYTIKAPTKWIVKDILFPASYADIFTSLRVGLATSISVLFFTETFGTKYGMGFFIMDSWVRVNYTQMYLGILWLGLIGFLLVIFIDKLEYHICKWRQ